jgi:hypothetical protein
MPAQLRMTLLNTRMGLDRSAPCPPTAVSRNTSYVSPNSHSQLVKANLLRIRLPCAVLFKTAAGRWSASQCGMQPLLQVATACALLHLCFDQDICAFTCCLFVTGSPRVVPSGLPSITCCKKKRAVDSTANMVHQQCEQGSVRPPARDISWTSHGQCCSRPALYEERSCLQSLTISYNAKNKRTCCIFGSV